MPRFDPDRVDLHLLHAIRDIRRLDGACTHDEIGRALGIAKPTAQVRIEGAQRRGHVKQSALHGSLRIGDRVGLVERRVLKGPGGTRLDPIELVILNGELLEVRLVVPG